MKKIETILIVLLGSTLLLQISAVETNLTMAGTAVSGIDLTGTALDVIDPCDDSEYNWNQCNNL